MSRSLVTIVCLPNFLWAKSINTTIFLVNTIFSCSNLELIPYYILTCDKLDLASKKIIISKDVRFDESKFFFQNFILITSQVLMVQYVFPSS
jgi:hypothetical protein